MPKTDMLRDIKRIFYHAWDFYTTRFQSIVLGFSVPLILAYAVLLLAQLPSYSALGAVFLRTISIPDLSIIDLFVIGGALILSNFIVADAITNINLLIKKKRTLSEISTEVWEGVTTYATRIFNIFIIIFLFNILFQLLTFEITAQSTIFPILMLIVCILLFFTPPAIVIDNEDTISAILHSLQLLMRLPLFYLPAIILWALFGLFLNTIIGAIAFLLLPYPYHSYFIMLINALFIYPLLLILQTQLYMEKYPLAK